MKRYAEYMSEIPPDKLYEALLGYGMFSEKMPPFTTSKPFFDYCQEKLHKFTNKARKYVYYENVRNVNMPRPLGIPTPMNYQLLCECLKENWEGIQTYFRKVTKNQNHKVSRIHIRRLFNSNSIFEMNYSNWRLDPNPDEDLLINKRYIVHADISKCFPSIYTHSIPWALIGKDKAKNDRSITSWYNRIDKATQNMKHGETHGLMIGPHASNLLSEIILCKVDNDLVKKGWEYIRNIDDYTCYVKTEEEARHFLIDLQAELREYDLSLNHGKTAISPLPSAATKNWVRKINSISITTNYDKVDYKNCRTYLDFAIETAAKENNDFAVLKYAIKVLSGLDLTDNAKMYMQKTVFHLSLIYPYLVQLLEKCIFQFCGTPRKEKLMISNKLYELGIKSRIYEAASYALFYAIKYDFTIPEVKAEEIIDSKDCILLLLGYKYFLAKNDEEAMRKLEGYATELSKNEDDFDTYWLFTYEVLSEECLKDDWKVMKQKKVSFIKDKTDW